MPTVAPAGRALHYFVVQYRRWWRTSLLISFINPALYLAAMGVGLGGLIDHGGSAAPLGGHSYLAFLAPGLLAATAMQTAVGENTWPVGNAMRWSRSYVAMVATPLRPSDAMAGHVLFAGARAGLGAGAFLVVAALFGALDSPWAVAAWPVAVLCGLAHAAPAAAFSVGRTHDQAYAALQRFVVIPLFLFSGVFFPISQLPAVLRVVAWATPLWHGVALCRDLCLGQAHPLPALGHVAYLACWALVGGWLAAAAYRKALAT
ncbi:MAG TPA: ABC transporter permease [Sporichthyaceae bacterium]|jgi:lipooligosaccharide transport system permease protein|nr:ABC transporter permease [Sporichthyaceae bacterium]